MNNQENLKKFTTEHQPKNNGAPKGKRLTTIIKELLEKDISKFDTTKKGMTVNEALATELITMALHKDSNNRDKLNAIKEILDRMNGKPNQTVENKTTITEFYVGGLNNEG